MTWIQALSGNWYVYLRCVHTVFHQLPQDGPFRTTISEPLGKMCAYFPVVNEHITKRNKKVNELFNLFGYWLNNPPYSF